MKTKKMLFWGVGAAVAALMSFASCSQPPVAEFKLATNFVEVAPGEEFVLNTENATGDITWTINNTDGSFEATPNAGKTAMTIVGVKVGGGSVKAVCGGVERTAEIVVVGAEKEAVPQLLHPGPGLMRIAIRVPAGTCNGLYAIGDFSDNAGEANAWTHNKTSCVFSKVADTETWYQLDVTADGLLALKVCAVPEELAPAWDYQWGKNTTTAENVTVAQESAVVFVIDNTENGGEVKLNGFDSNDNGIIYLDVAAWKTAPCAPVIPAGTGTFTITFSEECGLTSESVVNLRGNFDSGWTIVKEMTYVSGTTWTWTGDYPENFQYKVESAGTWYGPSDNWIFDGTTFDQSWTCEAPVE